MMNPLDWYRSLPEDKRKEVDALLAADKAAAPWRPLVDIADPTRPTPQQQAYESNADVLFYGGAAGGGKSDLGIGLALTRHKRSIIFRREAVQLVGIEQRIAEIIGGTKGYNSQKRVWSLDGRVIELGHCQHPGDEMAYQGRPHDLIVFDEITHFREQQFRFLSGWLRSTEQGQRCRIVCTGNPPTDAEGEWVIRYWAPWLDDSHPRPALPGELRWYAVIDGEDVEVEGPEPFEHKGETVTPKSRTFIPSSVDDNPFLASTGYKATLQALPEPLRSQMLKGDFLAGQEDDPWQVIPAAWVKAAQERWAPNRPRGPMAALGVDPARGGRDETILMPRYGDWFGEVQAYSGGDTPDGPSVAALVVTALRDGAPAFVDVIGIGSSVYDHLRGNGVNVVAVNGSHSSTATDRSGRLRFVNKRAELWWRMREALDPAAEYPIALPPDARLRADLCAPRWRMTARGVQVESKEDIIKRLGRSPDRGDAAVYALQDAPSIQKRRNRNLPTSTNVLKWRR